MPILAKVIVTLPTFSIVTVLGQSELATPTFVEAKLSWWRGAVDLQQPVRFAIREVQILGAIHCNCREAVELVAQYRAAQDCALHACCVQLHDPVVAGIDDVEAPRITYSEGVGTATDSGAHYRGIDGIEKRNLQDAIVVRIGNVEVP